MSAKYTFNKIVVKLLFLFFLSNIVNLSQAKSQSCIVEFSYTAGVNPDSIHFTPHGTAATHYNWSFGDGTTSTDPSPSHVYAGPGIYITCITIATATGDTCSRCDTVEVHVPSHTCHIEFSYTAGVNPDSIVFTPHGSVGTQYFWTFGDGSTSTDPSPLHVYSGPGLYVTCISIVTALGDTCDRCDTVEVHPPSHTCNVEFSYVAVANPDSIVFTPHGTAAVQYFWTFGDGATSTASSPSHVYAGPGIYIACITIVTALGDTCDRCDTVEVHGPTHTCNVEFSYVAGANPDSIIFTPHGTAAVSYFWTFGDGSTSTDPSPSHVYSGPGIYITCITIVTAFGDTCDRCDTVEVHQPSHTCNVEFSYVAGANPDSIIFTPHGTTAVSYFWTFGDGSTSTDPSPSHVYLAPGIYITCITIVTALGDTCDRCDTVEVHPPNHTCITEFTYTAGTNPDSIHFTPHGTPGVSWFWTFGDGSTSTDQSPWHVYAGQGVYYTCLTIINALGDTCDRCDSVEVHGPSHICHVEFSYASSGNPDSIHFTASGTPAVSYFWSFGDGSTSTDPSPWHFYSGLGIYHACLIIVNALGDSCDYCHLVEVHTSFTAVCQVEFSYAAGNNPDSIHFTPHGTAASDYMWIFGDGQSSTDPSPWHYYHNPGAYHVCVGILTTAGGGCDRCDSIGSLISVGEINLIPEVNVYPNPSNEYSIFTIRNIKHSFDLMLYNITGQIVYSRMKIADDVILIDTRGIQSGIYYYSLFEENHSFSNGLISIVH